MIAALEAFVLLIVLLVAVALYRRLIHSTRFSRLVSEVTQPSPESDEEVVINLNRAEDSALACAEMARQIAAEKRKTATKIQRRVRRKPEIKENP